MNNYGLLDLPCFRNLLATIPLTGYLDWFMNTYNAGKSFQSVLPEILAQQAAMASDDDEDEDEDDE